ncbi:MAG: hypothetical protein ACLRNQ_09375 [Flavonifractor plautii]
MIEFQEIVDAFFHRMEGHFIAVFDIDAPFSLLQAGKLSAKRFRNASSEK